MKCLKPEEEQDENGYYYPMHQSYDCYTYCLAKESKSDEDLLEIAELHEKRYLIKSILGNEYSAHFALRNTEDPWSVIEDILSGCYLSNYLRENGLFDIACDLLNDERESLINCLRAYDQGILNKMTLNEHRRNQLDTWIGVNIPSEECYKKELEYRINDLKKEQHEQS